MRNLSFGVKLDRNRPVVLGLKNTVKALPYHISSVCNGRTKLVSSDVTVCPVVGNLKPLLSIAMEIHVVAAVRQDVRL
jgi:hypothetical protein